MWENHKSGSIRGRGSEEPLLLYQALRQWQRDLTAHWHSLTFTVYEETHHTRPGRPRKYPSPEDIRTQWRIKITRSVRDTARRQQELDRRNTFVLMPICKRWLNGQHQYREELGLICAISGGILFESRVPYCAKYG